MSILLFAGCLLARCGTVYADTIYVSYEEKYFSEDVVVNGGSNLYGLTVHGNTGIANLSGDISMDGTSMTGVWAPDYGVAFISGDINVAGYNAQGVNAVLGGKAYVSGDVTIYANDSHNSNSHGVRAALGEVYVDGEVKATGAGVFGIYADLNGNPTGSSFVRAGSVNVTGDSSFGVASLFTTEVSVDGVITMTGNDSYGALAQEGGLVRAGSVVVSGDRSSALYVYEGGASVVGDVTLTGSGVTGDYAFGLYARSSDVSVGGSVSVSGDMSRGVYAIRSSQVSVAGDVTLITYGDATRKVYGVYAGTNNAESGVVSIGVVVYVSADNGAAVYALDRSEVSVGGIVVSGDNSTGAYAENSKVNITDGSVLLTGSDGAALEVEGNGAISLSNVVASADGSALLYTESSGSVTASAGSKLYGDVINDNGSYANETLALTLSGASSLTGGVADVSANSVTNLTLSGAGDAWYVTDNSLLKGTLVNLGSVNFSSSLAGTAVTTANLGSGAADNGTFVMNTDIVGGTGDKVVVTGNSTGAYSITIRDGNTANNGSETLTIIETADGGADFALTNNYADIGSWRYGLQREAVNAGNWQLFGTGEASAPASASVNTFSAAYLLSYAETQTLMQRLGDLRQTPYLSGLWFRVHGGKFESNSKSFVRGFDMDYGGVQIGYDRKLDTRLGGDLYAGIMFSYSKGDLDYLESGGGEVNSKLLGVYGTYIRPDGFYVDAVLKYQWMENEFDVLDSVDHITGSGVSTGGFGASLEAGKRFHVGRDKALKQGWYVEPQAQLSYMRQDGGYFTASNQLHIGVDGFTSLIGRVGMLVGYETNKSNFYAKVSRLHEFDGDVTIVANDQAIGESFGGSWWVYGLGYTAAVDGKNSIYVDVERSSGGSFTQPWRISLGWRMLF